MERILLSLVCCLLIVNSSISQVDFQIKSLDEIQENRPIFIAVYATFSKPWGEMDHTTFQDSIVSDILNNNFNCLKWDAEDDKFKQFLNKYDISDFPTLLFLDENRELINNPIDFLRSKDLSQLSREVLKYIELDPLETLDITSLTFEETSELLSRITWLKSPEKSQLLYHFIELLERNDSLWNSNFDLITRCADYDLELNYVEILVYFHEPVSLNSNRSFETVAKTQIKLSKILEYRLEKAKKAADYELYHKISNLRGELALSSGHGRLPSYNNKQLKADRLEYYRYNKLIDLYKPLADSLIEIYILPYSPEEALLADQSKSQQTAALLKRANLEQEKEDIDSTSLDFYRDQHYNGLKIADRLDEIANSILTLYDDKEEILDALRYSILSYEYLNLPKYLATRAKLYYKLGEKDKALKIINECKNHQYFESERLNIDEVLKYIDRDK